MNEGAPIAPNPFRQERRESDGFLGIGKLSYENSHFIPTIIYSLLVYSSIILHIHLTVLPGIQSLPRKWVLFRRLWHPPEGIRCRCSEFRSGRSIQLHHSFGLKRGSSVSATPGAQISMLSILPESSNEPNPTYPFRKVVSVAVIIGLSILS